MRRALMSAGLALTAGLGAVVVAQEIREPVAGVCVRPLIGEGGLLNLPLVDIPGQRIPNQSLELTVGGQYRDCKV